MVLPRFSRLLTAVGLFVICAGAASSRSCRFDGLGGGNGDDPDFVTSLKLQTADGQITDTFNRDETIDLVLTVRNRLDSAAQVDFPSTRTSDFVVVRENTSDVVWKWSNGRAFNDVVTTLDFDANETQTFTFTWDQTDNNGVPLRDGNYEARGVLVYSDFDANPLKSNQLGSALVRFTVR
jgi:hypothetical protein